MSGKKYKEDSAAVQAHLGMIQSVIQRTASNSSMCKAWCITLVSAILVVVADKGKPGFIFIAAIPTILFFVLDTYYLALERCFRNSYNGFIKKLHFGTLVAEDLFAMSPSGSVSKAFWKALGSFSIWPFYGALGFMIWIAKQIVIP